MRFRMVLGGLGVLLLGYGAYRILTNAHATNVSELVKWLVAAVVLHDGVLTPLTLLVAAVLGRAVPGARARRYLQGALVAGALVSVIAIPMIYRRGSQPRSKGLEQQNYGAHLAVLLGLIAAVTVLAYVISVLRRLRSRDAQAASETNVRRSAVQTSELP